VGSRIEYSNSKSSSLKYLFLEEKIPVPRSKISLKTFVEIRLAEIEYILIVLITSDQPLSEIGEEWGLL
jgi:hypothetical protein